MILSSAAVDDIAVPLIEYAAAFTYLNPVISLFASTITALLAVIVPAATASNTVSSDEARLVSPITRVAPLKCKSFQVLVAEPKLKVLVVVGIKSADILFGSNPPPCSANIIFLIDFSNRSIRLVIGSDDCSCNLTPSFIDSCFDIASTTDSYLDVSSSVTC